ncbi:MAG TPA: VCBS repeat-containing protein, partial [Chitinophagales bacterium]|nr:VCBS repeat-containing protein [Chitinophagales bacterium]
MKRISTLCLVVLLLLANALHAQRKYRVISVPVNKNGRQMRDPWTGGMDSPQFSEGDLNHDGIPDLFVFDRVGGRVLTYLGNAGAVDTMFTYSPQYERLFPQDLQNWAVLRDYNHDGIPDIFTYANSSNGPGIRVFKGSMVDGLIHFDLVCPLIVYSDGVFSNYVFVNIADFPAIVDVNHDGDIDVLAYDRFGSAIGYYENQHAENTANPAYALDS